MESEENVWEALRALWIKYCGVADEYKMLRDRWLYLHREESLNLLPNLRNSNDLTFDLLNKHVKRLDSIFEKKFFLQRTSIESFDKSKRKIKKASLQDYSELKYYFFDLSAYVGLLKLAFFQRTVSSEISHVASGVPHSPERTIGNELFYLAADKVAERFYKCLNLPEKYGKWDGFITFAPPITEKGFSGGFFRPSKSLKLFHISLSEEQKYFVGEYLILAHEFGHAAIFNLKERDGLTFDVLRSYSMNRSIENLKDNLSAECDKCPNNPRRMCKKMDKVIIERDPFEEYFADIIALKISGPHIINAILNEIIEVIDYCSHKVDENKNSAILTAHLFNPEPILRFSGMLSYANKLGFSIKKEESCFRDFTGWSKEVIENYVTKLK